MLENKRIKIVIADGDGNFLDTVKKYLNKRKDMEVLATATNGEEAIRVISRTRPDIVLLDVLLPKKEGFTVMEELRKYPYLSDTCFIMISAFVTDTVVKKALILGAKYFVVKPFCEDSLVTTIRLVYTENSRNKNISHCNYLKAESEALTEENEEKYIVSMLTKLRISHNVNGYFYLKMAIEMTLEDENIIIGITKKLYPAIAKKYHTSASRVERAMRHAIESSWKKGGNFAYCDLMDYNGKEKPTNSQFIATVSEYIRLNKLQKNNRGTNDEMFFI